MVDLEKSFFQSWDAVQSWCYRIAKMKGFHDKPRDPLAALALIVSECAEAMEAIRKDPNAPSEHIGDEGYTQLEEELADIIIRVFDFAEEVGAKGDMQKNDDRLDLVGAIFAKVRYNSKRPRLHGKRC